MNPSYIVAVVLFDGKHDWWRFDNEEDARQFRNLLNKNTTTFLCKVIETVNGLNPKG